MVPGQTIYFGVQTPSPESVFGCIRIKTQTSENIGTMRDMLTECLGLAYLLTDGEASWNTMLQHNFKWIALAYLQGSIIQGVMFWIADVGIQILQLRGVPQNWKRYARGTFGFYVGAWSPIVKPRFHIGYLSQGLLVFVILTLYVNRKNIMEWIRGGSTPSPKSTPAFADDSDTLSSGDSDME